MTRRERLERLAAAILARMQAQAAARMDRHGRPQTNPYMTNAARPANHACRNTRQAGRGKGRVGQNPSTRLMRPSGTGPKRRKA